MLEDILFVDIETAADEEMAEFVTKPSLVLESEAPKNYKKPETIMKWMVAEADKREAKYVERLARMPLDIDYARIVTIGYALGEGRVEMLVACDDGLDHVVEETIQQDIVVKTSSEGGILRVFWDLIAPLERRVCGYNVLGFDLPVILRRSWQYGVLPRRKISQ